VTEKAKGIFPCPICGKPCRRTYYSLRWAQRQPCSVCHHLERARYYKQLSDDWMRRYHEAKAKREQLTIWSNSNKVHTSVPVSALEMV